MNDGRNCCVRISKGMGFGRTSQCSRLGIVTAADGKHYCRQHDPVAREARRDENHRQRFVLRNARAAEFKFQQEMTAYHEKCAALVERIALRRFPAGHTAADQAAALYQRRPSRPS